MLRAADAYREAIKAYAKKAGGRIRVPSRSHLLRAL
jgi:hypothetical protein